MLKLLRILTCSVSEPLPQLHGKASEVPRPRFELSAVIVHVLKMAEQDVEDEEEDDAEKNQPLGSATSTDAAGCKHS